ncbi:hypothetical protein B0H11DRAFT_1902536 [Mycena galericulata]|nr:hypothetical protein B0H11DRAFT_1902536 [Mycena galericulata]
MAPQARKKYSEATDAWVWILSSPSSKIVQDNKEPSFSLSFSPFLFPFWDFIISLTNLPTTPITGRTASRGESPLGLMRKDGEIRLDTRRIRVLSMVRARGEKWGATPANFSSADGSPQREGCVPVRQVGFGTGDSASRGAQADAVRSGDRTKPPSGPRAQRMPCSDAGSTVQEGTSAVVAPSRTQIFGSERGRRALAPQFSQFSGFREICVFRLDYREYAPPRRENNLVAWCVGPSRSSAKKAKF